MIATVLLAAFGFFVLLRSAGMTKWGNAGEGRELRLRKRILLLTRLIGCTFLACGMLLEAGHSLSLIVLLTSLAVAICLTFYFRSHP